MAPIDRLELAIGFTTNNQMLFYQNSRVEIMVTSVENKKGKVIKTKIQ